MAQYEVNNSSIQTLLSWIRNGELAVPEIQRPFVWNATKVRDLIDSLYSGFPVGYIVIWKNPDIRLKDGSISQGKKILIDGQQRITALQAAIVGEEVVDDSYRKKPIRIAFNPQEERFDVQNAAIKKITAWIPDISVLFKPQFDAFNFVIDYCNNNHLDNEKRSTINAVITKLKQIENNNLGIIELSSQLDIVHVTEIFIRINSKGVSLSQADFAMSKISADDRYNGNQIRKMIDYFCHLMQKPEDFSAICQNDSDFANSTDFQKIKWVVNINNDIYTPDYTDVLRVAFTFKFLRGRLADLVSLLSGRDFKTREYQETIAEDSFNKLHDGVLDFVNQTNFQRYLMIIKSTGIVSSSMIRSQNVLNFGYALYLLLRAKNEDATIIEKIVRCWLVLTILTSRYSSSPESTFDYDIKHFNSNEPLKYLAEIESGELSDAFWNNSLITKLTTPVSSSPMFKVFLMAQVKAGDLGFLSEHIDVESLIMQRGDIHHIFPRKYLQNHGTKEKRAYNQIANYVYTQSEINIKIKDSSPRDYMGAVKMQCETKTPVYGGITSKEKLIENLRQNCIPEEIFDMDYQQYDKFLDLRRKLIAQKIKSYYESLK